MATRHTGLPAPRGSKMPPVPEQAEPERSQTTFTFRSGPNALHGALIVLGGLLLVLGSFLPWIVVRAPFVGTLSKSGMEGGDGVVSIGLGIAAVIVGYRWVGSDSLSPWLRRLPILIMAGTVLLAVVELIDINDRIEAASTGFVSGSVGAGIWTLLVGAALVLIGGGLLRLPKQEGPRDPEGPQRPSSIPPE